MEKETNPMVIIQSLIDEKSALLLYFYNDHCAPCKSLRPKVIEMKETYFPELELYFVNSDTKEIPSQFAVYDYPTLLVYFDGKEYIRASKYVSTVQLKEQIDRYYKLMFD